MFDLFNDKDKDQKFPLVRVNKRIINAQPSIHLRVPAGQNKITINTGTAKINRMINDSIDGFFISLLFNVCLYCFWKGFYISIPFLILCQRNYG